MKTNKLILGVSVLFVAGSLTFTSCKKKTTITATPSDTEANTARDNATAENTSNDIVSIGGEVSESGSLTQYRNSGVGMLEIAPCATVTGILTSTITVDFGTTGCLCQDERTRKGKLIFDLSGSVPASATHYRNPGFKMVVTSQGYVVDSNQVNIINKTITNTTPASIGNGTPTIGNVNLTWHIQSNISITKANGNTITWICDRTKELTNTNDATANCYHGQTLPITWSKAVVKLNGTASGTNAKGESYTATATNLVRDFNCSPSTLLQYRHPFISGTIDYKPGSRPDRLFDYGSGGCDFNATVTINGVTYAITLP